MASRVDRVNRVVLTLLGLVLLLAGAAALGVGYGAFGADREGSRVLPTKLSTFIADNRWYWSAVSLGCLVVAYLTLRWLFAQLHTSRLSKLDVEPDRSIGETVLRSGAIADAVQDQVEGLAGVRAASMRLFGTPSTHRHRLTVYLDGRADINDVRSRLVTETVPDLRRALDFDDVQLDIRLVLAPRPRRTVS